MTVKTKSRVSRSHEDATVESFRKDPAFAAEYLNSILEDGDQEELMLALRRMSKAFGGVQKLAGQAKLNANTLYRTLSPKGNPGNAANSPTTAETGCIALLAYEVR